MNDKIITRAIAKIHRRVLAFFFFLFLAGFFAFIALLEGFTVSHLKFGDIKIEQLYLKWDTRLHVKASLIDFSYVKQSDEPFSLKPLSQLPDMVHWMEQWIYSIHIQSLRYKQLDVSLHYSKNHTGKLHFFIDKQPILNGRFSLTPTLLKASFDSNKTKTEGLSGHFTLFIPEQKMVSKFQLQIPDTPILHLTADGNESHLSIKGEADGVFTSLEQLSNFFQISPDIKPWLVDNVKGKNLTLHKLNGEFDYNKPDSLIKNIFAEASLDDVEYTFAPTIAPIKSKKVNLTFKDGNLYINPQNGTFYNLPTETSSLYIDFTAPHTMLYANILTKHAQLNDSILALLSYYDITVPVKQLNGICDVDLKLAIRLYDGETSALGTFTPGPSKIQLDDYLFDTAGGKVMLDTTKVTIQDFDAKYKNLAFAKVDGEYDAHNDTGSIRIAPYYAVPTDDNNTLSLHVQPGNSPLITYHITPKEEHLEVSNTKWKIMGQLIDMDGFSIPFDYKKGTGIIPRIHLSVAKKMDGYIKGIFSKEDFQLDLSLQKLKFDDLSLMGDPLTMNIRKTDTGRIATVLKPTVWNYKGETVILSPLAIQSDEKNIILKNINMKIDQLLQANISGYYDRKKMKGRIIFSDTKPLSSQLRDYIDIEKIKTLHYDASKESFSLYCDDIGFELTSIPLGWKINVPDLSTVSKNSPILRKYELSDGYMNLYYLPKNKRYSFDGNINYPYELMVINGQNTSRYRISGSYYNGKTIIRVNDRITIERENSTRIRANNVGLNLQEMYRWYKNHRKSTPVSDDETSTAPLITLNTTNTDFYLSSNRKILSDALNAKIDENGIDARLMHGQGSADFQMVNDILYVNGNGFNDRFMNSLFSYSNIKGGSLSFRLAGTTSMFEGIVRVDKGVLRDYKLLNNVLSFINTIPSLVTFSLPNYNSVGLPLNEAYAHFVYKHDQFHFDNITFDSPEMKIGGDIKANFKEDSIYGDLTLKTDIGSTFSKIPVVGYILLGENGSISTTLNIKGKLSDPKVETAIAKEILTAPYNILKRTITYPFAWMLRDEKKQ